MTALPAATLGWSIVENPSVRTTSGSEIRILDRDGNCLGEALVIPAEDVPFGELVGLPKQALTRSIAISDVRTEPALDGEIRPALLYLALRRGRIWDRATVMTCVDAAQRNEDARLLSLDPLPHASSHAGLVPVAQRLDVAIHHAWNACGTEQRALLREQFVAEALDTLDRWIPRFCSSPWFQALYAGRLTRPQYIYTLSNLHQFVRWTTRLLGRAVAYSHDRTLRSHWLHHLEDEINHELILEKDLANLGADPRYVVEAMLPHPTTHQFMVVQESMIGFHQDPVSFMGSPFVAEGYAARLDQGFLDALASCARRWGVQNPQLVTSFYASHINYDGGEDGHFAQVREVLAVSLKNDLQLQQFLNVVRMCTDATERSYTAYVNDLSIFDGPLNEDQAR
jgi:hypothetical protein